MAETPQSATPDTPQPPPQVDWQNDPDFHALPLNEKHKALMAIDPDYAALPAAEQSKAINAIHYGPQGPQPGVAKFEASQKPSPKDTGILGRAKQYGSDLLGMGTGVLGAVTEMQPYQIASHAIDVGKQDVARNVAGRSLPYRGIAALGSAAGVDPTGMEESAEHGDPGGVLTHAAAQATPILAAGAVDKFGGKIRDVAGRGKDATGMALRTERDALRPGVRTVARVGGGLLGGGAGHLLGFPESGAIVGGLAGPTLADAILPKRPFDIPTKEPLGASLPSSSEFYENKGADLLKRGKEQSILDRPTYQEARQAARQSAKEEAAAREPVSITEGPTALEHEAVRSAQSAVAKRNARQLVPVNESPNALDRAAANPRATPFDIGKPLETGPEIEGEGRPATWTNKKVLELASKGNRAAIAQAGVRGLELPPNARYVMGDVDYRNMITSPREVTKFTPEGQPIRQSITEPIGEGAPYMDEHSIQSPFPERPVAVNGGLTESLPPDPEAARQAQLQATERRSIASSGQPPEGTPERRTLQRGITTQYDLPTEGEQLEREMRQAREGKSNGMTEGEALQRIMRDPELYAKYKAADQKTQGRMLIEAKNQ